MYNKKILIHNLKTQENDLHYTKANIGMKMVKEGYRAFHIQDSLAYHLIGTTFSQKEVCELSEIEMLEPQLTQIVVQKNSRFRKIMAYSLRRITEHGILDREMKFWRTPKPKCVRNLKSEDIQVGANYVDVKTFNDKVDSEYDV